MKFSARVLIWLLLVGWVAGCGSTDAQFVTTGTGGGTPNVPPAQLQIDFNQPGGGTSLPLLTGEVSPGVVSEGRVTGLSIPVTAGTRVIAVVAGYSSPSSGVTVDGRIAIGVGTN